MLECPVCLKKKKEKFTINSFIPFLGIKKCFFVKKNIYGFTSSQKITLLKKPHFLNAPKLKKVVKKMH